MTPVPTAPPPGSPTVPILFGWEQGLTVLVVVVLVAVAGLVLLAAGRAGSAREDWRSWLDSRSAQRRSPSTPERCGTPAGEEPGPPVRAP